MKDYIIQFEGLLSFADAAAIWGRSPSTFRRAAAEGRLVIGEDCAKFGKVWVIKVDAAARLCGYHGMPDYGPWQRYLARKAAAAADTVS